MTVMEKEKQKKQENTTFINTPSDSERYRRPEFYNIWRRMFQYIVTHIGYMITFKIMYRLEVYGRENLPEHNEYIAASNHLSTLDPPLVCAVLNKGGAFMAKKELFDNLLLRWWLNWLGAFAVDRDNLSVATIKTALQIKQTGWVLGIFPQGTRQEPGKITNVTKGFANLARKTKCGILPIGIVGTNNKAKIPFTGKVIVRIGELIPYSDNVQEMVDKWGKAVEELTGFEYVPSNS